MYYRLRPQYILRGWDKLPTGVVDTTCGEVVFETVRNFNVLKKCTGLLDFDSIFVNDEERKALEEVKNYLEESETPMEQVSERQLYRKYENRFVRSAHWSITGKCNYRCRHCYMSAPEGALGEMPVEKCMDIIEQMSECGILSVSLTGGEALVHPHFWEIVDGLLKKGIVIGAVYSNGFLINEDTLSKFEERGIKPRISLSFDGTGGWHSWLRGVQDADSHIEKAFQLCREHGFDTDAEMCLHKGNLDRLEESIDYLAGLGCGSVKVNRLSLEGNALGIADKELSVEETCEAFLDYIPKFIGKGCPTGLQLSALFAYNKNFGIRAPGYKFTEPVDESRYCMCGHARNYMYINCEGRVLPCIPFDSCEGAREHFEKLTEKPLKSLLTESYYFTCISTTLEKYFEKNPGCRECEYRYCCAGGCRGCAIGRGGDYDFFAVDQEICLMHTKGYFRRVIELCEDLCGRKSNVHKQEGSGR